MADVQTGRALQAWDQTADAKDWHRQFFRAVLVFAATSLAVAQLFPSDLSQSLIIGVVAGGTLLLVGTAEIGWHYFKLGRPLKEVRRAISKNIESSGVQEMMLKEMLERKGVTPTPSHLGAVRALYANGDIDVLTPHIRFNGETGQSEIFDYGILPVAGRFTLRLSNPSSAGPPSTESAS